MSEKRQATAEEFQAHKAAHVGKLEPHTVGFCTPAVIEYYDWSLPSKHRLGTYEYAQDHLVCARFEDDSGFWIVPREET